MQWNHTYGIADSDQAISVEATLDGGYIVAGATKINTLDTDALLVKTDALGNVVWNKTYGGSLSDGAMSVVVANDGGYAFSGLAEGTDAWLVKTDVSGNMQWSKTYSDGVAYGLIVTSDGGYAFSGYASSVVGDDDAWLVKTDAEGNMLWSNTFGVGDTNIERGYSLVAAADGGYMLAGNIYSFASGTSDVLLVKTDGFGVIPEIPSCLVVSLAIIVALPFLFGKKRLLNKKQVAE
jgi:hypothetical protein